MIWWGMQELEATDGGLAWYQKEKLIPNTLRKYLLATWRAALENDAIQDGAESPHDGWNSSLERLLRFITVSLIPSCHFGRIRTIFRKHSYGSKASLLKSNGQILHCFFSFLWGGGNRRKKIKSRRHILKAIKKMTPLILLRAMETSYWPSFWNAQNELCLFRGLWVIPFYFKYIWRNTRSDSEFATRHTWEQV